MSVIKPEHLQDPETQRLYDGIRADMQRLTDDQLQETAILLVIGGALTPGPIPLEIQLSAEFTLLEMQRRKTLRGEALLTPTHTMPEVMN